MIKLSKVFLMTRPFIRRSCKSTRQRYDPEAVFWGTSAKTIAANPAAVAEYFKDAGKNPRVTLGEQLIRVYGDVAINTGYSTFGNPARFTFVYRNRWKMVNR
jgi:hypothetical protein